MKNILKLAVTQIRVFNADTIGFQFFRTTAATESIRQRFGFSIPPSPFAGLPVEIGSMQFATGQFELDSKKHLVESLVIEERRILFTMEASSEVAHAFFDSLRSTLLELDLRDDKPAYEPLIVAEETVCIAQLSFDISALLNDKLLNLQEDLKKAAQLPGGDVEIFPASVKLAIHYSIIPEELKLKKVGLSDKEVAFEVRAKTNPSDRVFFTKSPFGSATHISLIEKLEKHFGS